jgi:hypothetical protein
MIDIDGTEDKDIWIDSGASIERSDIKMAIAMPIATESTIVKTNCITFHHIEKYRSRNPTLSSTCAGIEGTRGRVRRKNNALKIAASIPAIIPNGLFKILTKLALSSTINTIIK